ncbi:hypothetical protein AB0M54_47585 [Actinoplanes sp. NPDC051470]|uniref:hypothetical protein n=1 Tax=unclassified Actinoplanes TaxID=2626549 RepID=UPI00344111F6
MDMDTTAMTGAMEMMDTAGRVMTTGWGAVSGQVTSLGGRLGQGELGAAYMAGYPRTTDAIMATVERHCGQPAAMAAMGHQCADLYGSAEQNAVTNLGAVTPAAPPAGSAAAPADPRLP